jgi:uncharacterized membrane protein
MRRHWDLGEYFWGIPLIYVASSIALAVVLPRWEARFFPELALPVSINSTIAILSSIASGMMALTGIVFSLAFVMVQFNATAYSPRLVLWMARDPYLFHSIGIFSATFIYAIGALVWVDRENSGHVPFLTSWFAILLVIGSVVMLAMLVQRLASLKITSVLRFVGRTGRRVVAETYPLLTAADAAATTFTSDNGRSHLPAIQQTLTHRGAPKVIASFDFESLARIATTHECVIEIVEAVGETTIEGTPLLHVRGGSGQIREAALRNAIHLGAERTFEQDPKYAFRLLVDIAIKALSPAINDPTTAVQALDHIEDLLCCVGRRRIDAGCVRDALGIARVYFPTSAWPDYVSLALDEIRFYGAESIQVVRRLRALLRDVIPQVPPDRRAALRVYLGRIDEAVPRSFQEVGDRRVALVEDRQGLGLTRH